MNKLFTFILLSFFIFSCERFQGDKNLKIIYYPDSEVIKQSVEYKDGKKHGLFQEYYRNGNPKTVQHYRNDTITDTSFFFHENGKPANYQVFKKNQRSGCWKKFNKEGREYWCACFENGLLNGTSTEYSYRTIHLISRLNFKDNIKDGKQEFFYNNGKPKSVTWFSHGQIALGTEEWTETGRKIDNDFKIVVTEKNEVLMKNMLSFIIKLENPQPGDRVYEISKNDTGRKVTPVVKLFKKDGYHLIEFPISRGGFVMEEVHLAAFRTTGMGNTYVKKTKFIASANNF